MHNTALNFENKRELVLALWIVITLSQVIYKTAPRSGELFSTLIITAVALGLVYGGITMYSWLAISQNAK